MWWRPSIALDQTHRPWIPVAVSSRSDGQDCDAGQFNRSLRKFTGGEGIALCRFFTARYKGCINFDFCKPGPPTICRNCKSHQAQISRRTFSQSTAVAWSIDNYNKRNLTVFRISCQQLRKRITVLSSIFERFRQVPFRRLISCRHYRVLHLDMSEIVQSVICWPLLHKRCWWITTWLSKKMYWTRVERVSKFISGFTCERGKCLHETSEGTTIELVYGVCECLDI